MQNLSQYKLEQITKKRNLLQNELEQIAKMGRIKNYKKMLKEELLIALLKSKQSHAKLYKSKSNNAEIEETKKIFNRGEWKIQLTMRINFISSFDTGELRTMHSKSDNVNIMMGIETNDVINELFKSFLEKYQEGLETKMRGSQFVYESVDLLYYSLHKISLNKGGSYIDFPSWIKHKGATINSQNKDNEYFK